MTLMAALQRTDCAWETAEFRGRDEPVRPPTVPFPPASQACMRSKCWALCKCLCINLVPPEISDLRAETITRRMNKTEGKHARYAAGKNLHYKQTKVTSLCLFHFGTEIKTGILSAQFQSTQSFKIQHQLILHQHNEAESMQDSNKRVLVCLTKRSCSIFTSAVSLTGDRSRCAGAHSVQVELPAPPLLHFASVPNAPLLHTLAPLQVCDTGLQIRILFSKQNLQFHLERCH